MVLDSKTRVPKLDALMQLLKRVDADSDLPEALRGMFDNSAAKHAVIHKQSIEVPGSVTLDRSSFRPPLAAVAVMGDLTIEGDLLAQDYNLDTVLFVAGNLRVRHLVKAWMPVFVLGNLTAEGYVLGQGSDGLLRVGGDLTAAGYVPLCEDWPSMRGHVIAGKVNARTPAGDHKRFFVPEALTNGLLDPALVMARHAAGLPVWRDTVLPPKPKVKPLRVKLKPGVLPADARRVPLAESRATMLDQIVAVRGEQSEEFAEFVRDRSGAEAIVLPDGAVIDGDLVLDGPDVHCLGTVHVKGDIVNDNLDNGPLLFAAGDVYCDNIRKGGSPFVILGNVNAAGVVIAEYNHGVVRIGGDLTAKLFLIMDHDAYVAGRRAATVVDTDDQDPAEVLVDEAFVRDELMSERVHALARSGRAVLR